MGVRNTMSGQQPPPDPWRAPGQPPSGPYGPYGPSDPYGPPPYGQFPPYGQPPHGQAYPPPPPPGWSAYPAAQPGWSAPGAGWAPPPPPRRAPAKVLYAIPVVLVLGAVAALTVFFVTRADELRVAGQTEKVGRTDSGVSVLARPGWHYDIYLPDSEESPTVGSCTFQTDAPVNGVVPVDTSTSGDDYFTDDQERDWVQVGTITAPDGVSGRSRLTCTGFNGLMDVNPDQSVFGWMVLVIILSLFTFFAGMVVFVVLLVLRGLARRPKTPPPAAAPGYGYAGW